MNGIDRIANAFQSAQQSGRAALILYFTLGYPNPDLSLSVIKAAAEAGADLIELGIPFSDPLADGPTIQRSSQVALQQGISVAGCLEMAKQLRAAGLTQPLVTMGYLNPLLAYGVDRFVQDAVQAGVDGFIIPDLPLEEAQDIETACRQQGLALIYLAPPNAAPGRLSLLAERTSGFLYLVSVKGVTGARSAFSSDLGDFVERARAVAHTPVAVGFGIATPEQAAAVGQMAQGVIVGSALINTMDANPEAPVQAVKKYVASLIQGMKN